MTYTELDDLKSAWQMLNRNLERQNALAVHQFREQKLPRFRSGFRPLVIGQIIQIIWGVLLALFGGSFWVDHIGVVHLMIYGISVHAYGVMLIVFAARDLYLIKRMDYAAPVLCLQKQIAELRAWHVRAALWFGVTGCFIWIPLMLMIFHRLGADIGALHPEVMAWFVLSSSLLPATLLCGLVFWLRRSGKKKLAKNIENNVVGRSVRRAQALLDEIERFEQEWP
jgi:hypothetical protein